MNTIKQLMMRIVPGCGDSLETMWAKVQHSPLSLRNRIGLRTHLAVCQECRDYHNTLEWVTATLKHFPGSPDLGASYQLSPDQKSKLREAISIRTIDSDSR